MILKGVPQNILNNMTVEKNLFSSFGVSSKTIKLCQLVENKKDLKMKLDFHAMKKKN